MESASIQFGYDDASVRAGVENLAKLLESTKAKADANLTLAPQIRPADDSALKAQFAAQAAAFGGMQQERELLQMRVAGREQEAGVLQRNIALQAEAVRIARETGIAEHQALEYAIQRASLQAQINRSGTQASRSAIIAPQGLPGGNARFQAGMVAAQVQDIAVGLQGGQRIATILGQQGSQLASIFGPTGMIVGGGLAIGAALLSVGINGKEAFEKLITGALTSHEEMTKLVATGGLNQLTEGMKKVKEEALALTAQRDSLRTLGTIWSTVLEVAVGGKGIDQKRFELTNALARTAFDELAVRKRVLEVSARELEVARLRASGHGTQADDLERQIKLQTTLAGIKGSSFDDDVKKQLSTNATAIAAAEKQQQVQSRLDAEADKARADAKAGMQRLVDLQAQLNDKQIDSLTGAAKFNALLELQGQQRNKAVLNGSGFDQANVERFAKEAAGRGNFSAAENALKNQIALQKTSRDLDEESKRMRASAASQGEEEFNRKKALRIAHEEFDLELNLIAAKAQAAGKESEAVNRLDAELRIKRLQQTVQTTLNVDAQTALNMATARVNAEDAITKAIKARQQASAQENIDNQLKLAQLQGANRTGAANQLQKQLAIKAKAKEIEDATGASPDDAEKQAKKLIAAQAKAQRAQARQDGQPLPRQHIMGGVSPNVDPMDQFYKNNPKLDPKLKLGPPVNAANPAAMQQAKKQLQQQNVANAGAQNLRSRQVSLAEGSTLIRLLTSIDQKLIIN